MVRPIALVVLALCFVPALLLAQSDTATVSGLVTDSKDAVLVGAQVRATNVECRHQLNRRSPTGTECMFSAIFVPDSTG